MTTKPATHKNVSWTPKGEVSDLLYNHCKREAGNYVYLRYNPQDVIREALMYFNVLPKKQWNCGDSSNWKPGTAIKTSLWVENANALADYAKDKGVTKQEVISTCVYEYLTTN